MKKVKYILLTLIIFIEAIFYTGCWNYREVNDFSIVAGVAVDKGINNNFEVTVEIIQINSGKDARITSSIISVEGNTMFDAARNLISVSGKRLYWSHAKTIILSKEIAMEGVTKVIEWYIRDAETREEAKILISQEESAKKIYADTQSNANEIKSFTLDKMISNQVSLSKAPNTDVWKFYIESRTKGLSTIIPSVNLNKVAGKIMPQVLGSAIIKDDKLIDFLNADETKDLLFIRNEIKSGILVQEMQTKDESTLVSLEIFESKTKIKPLVNGQDIKMQLKIATTVSIDEISGPDSFIDEESRDELKKNAEITLQKRVEYLIKKMQDYYDADTLGFASKLHEEKNQVWNDVKNTWDEVFPHIEVNVSVDMNIKNSAILSNSNKEGD